MKKYIWLLSILGIVFFTACGSSSEEAKELQTKQLKLIGIPQDIVANICQDDNTNGICEASELQAKVSFSQGDSMETIWSKLTLTSEGRYLLETYDPSKPLLLELQDSKSQHFTESFTLPFNGLKENEDEKELSILQTMIDKNALVPNNVSSAKVMKNVDDFYKTLLSDLEQNIKILKEKGLTTKQAVVGNIKEMADELITNGIENTIPAKMNACNGDTKCVNDVLTPLSTELILTDEEANSVSGETEEEEQPNNQGNDNVSELDLLNYFPTQTTEKTFITKDSYSEGERAEVDSYITKITRNANSIVYKDSDDEEETIVRIKENTLEIDAMNELNREGVTKYSFETPRYVNINDTTWNFIYEYKDENIEAKITQTCTLEAQINKFSHGGYTYEGDILKEKCIMDTSTNNNFEYHNILYHYFQKGIGLIAEIDNDCTNENGITQDSDGCKADSYSYIYLEK